ncbi:hypothetical protein H310_07279 [Aphanomyces invadans]|uniref:Uncharacterized protein n=1 Tax=Aphanomyces invadans TaxID=157072 RepID=A0A024U399_9STRA|nr:hypothetical protein H310_07279 [Aphanomyces invadans]ETW00729.1 hypothetical protein H310_07279 [Aphanomyces invadans]|eukprot:XP_008870864.1 hypothetical protein H310_07279 [Aphanomyces invadans]
MEAWEDIRRWTVKEPNWVPYAISNYEAITRDLDDEEREFELGLSSDDDDGLDVGFNDKELKQMEMLEAYGVQTDEITPEAKVPPLSPSASTTSMRSKKVLGDN